MAAERARADSESSVFCAIRTADYVRRHSVSVRAIERFLLPNTCVACERLVRGADPDALVCRLCLSRLVPVTGGCPRCQQPRPPVGPCRFCADWPTVLERTTSAVWLGDEATAMIHHLKYDGYAHLGAACAATLVSRMPRPANAVIVPIPLAPGRLRQRGFNQAETIGAALATAWTVPLASRLVVRVRETRTQTQLSPAERKRNLHQAFRARRLPTPGAGAERAAPTVILVDDVLTTGATLVAAATALATAGWTSIRAVTFARARPFAERVAMT